MGEVVFLGAFLLFCGYLFTLTFTFPVNIMDKSGGAGIFPRLVLLFLIIFLVIRIVQCLCKKTKEPFIFAEMFRGTRLFYLVCLVAYAALLKITGYFVCTTLFLVVTVNILFRKLKGNWGGVKSVLIRNILILLFVAVLNFFFAKVLHVMLPTGILLKGGV